MVNKDQLDNIIIYHIEINKKYLYLYLYLYF